MELIWSRRRGRDLNTLDNQTNSPKGFQSTLLLFFFGCFNSIFLFLVVTNCTDLEDTTQRGGATDQTDRQDRWTDRQSDSPRLPPDTVGLIFKSSDPPRWRQGVYTYPAAVTDWLRHAAGGNDEQILFRKCSITQQSGDFSQCKCRYLKVVHSKKPISLFALSYRPSPTAPTAPSCVITQDISTFKLLSSACDFPRWGTELSIPLCYP